MTTTAWTRWAAGTALSVVLCFPALSQSRGPVMETQVPSTATTTAADDWDHDGVRDLIHCLRILDLTEAQKMAIQQFIEGEKPTLQALHATLKSDRQILHTDASATPPDPCQVGSDYLTVRTDRLAISTEVDKIKTFIEGQLTDVQKALFQGCIKGTKADGENA